VLVVSGISAGVQVCVGMRWYVLVVFGISAGVCWYVQVCVGMRWYVLVCVGMCW